MPRISAVRLFKSHFPKAVCSRQSGGMYSTPYYLVHANGGQAGEMYVGMGDTKAQAWAAACESKNITSLKEE